MTDNKKLIEKAHTPTDDERESLVQKLEDEVSYRVRTAVALFKGGHAFEAQVTEGRASVRKIAAGFRRSEVPELRIRIADEISNIQVGSGSESTTIGITAALEAADALIAAGVVTEEPEWEYGYRPTYAPMHPEHPGEPMPEIWPTNRKPDEFLPGMGGPYRRTKMTPAGPWLPVES